jgi:hypothetical protein
MVFISLMNLLILVSLIELTLDHLKVLGWLFRTLQLSELGKGLW